MNRLRLVYTILSITFIVFITLVSRPSFSLGINEEMNNDGSGAGITNTDITFGHTTALTNGREIYHAKGDSVLSSDTVYLPTVMSDHSGVYYPPVNVGEHTTDTNGLFNVPLTGGGQYTFQLKNLLDETVTDVRVLSAENEAGVTVLVFPQEQGYAPLLMSFPASQYSSSMSALSPAQPLQIIRVTSYLDNEYVAVEQKIIYILGHLEALFSEMSDVVEDSVPNIGACDAITVGELALLIVHPPAAIGALVLEGSLIVVVHEACEEFLHGDLGNFDFARYQGSGLEDITILIPDVSIENDNGIAYGHVVDADSGLGLTEATVTLDAGYSQVTLNKGGFVFQGISPGSHTLSVSAPGYDIATGSFNVAAGQVTYVENLILAVKNPGALRLVNLTSGVVTAEVETQEQVDIASGQFQDWILPAGNYHIRAWTTACGGIAEADVTINAGEMLTLSVRCSQATTVEIYH